MGNLMKKLTNWIPLLILQIAASGAFTYFVIQSGLIPTKYLAALIAGEVVLAVAMFFLMKPSKKIGRHAAESSVKTMIGKIISLILSLCLCFGSSVVSKGGSTISKITNGVLKQTTYSVYVLKKSNINKVKDLNDMIVGSVPTITPESFMTASTKLNEEVYYKQIKYKKLSRMANRLIQNKIHAVLVNEDYVSSLEKAEPTWDSATKKIWSYTVTEDDESSKIDVTKTPFTMYICGVDGEVNGVRHDITVKSRADVNMIITVNPKTHQILMTSIPRDYFVTIHGIGEKDKLTHAALLGTPTSAATIEDFMGIKINFYSRVGFKMCEKLVDAIGGIRVYSDKAFTPWTNRKVFIKKGWQTMNGKQALAFARERKTYGEGDRHRAANQQTVIKAIIEKVVTPSGLANYDKVLDAIAGTFQTSITSNQLKDLINMQLDEMPKWTFQSSVLLDGEGIMTTGGYFEPN
ncbi:MAG TPA: hypothetical protein DCL62_02435, partial [Kandleria vitulina]|nr:hypothetical protein [Kandleria vitulina]